MTVTINGSGTATFTDASGNVGIGTSSPSTRLTVEGTSNIKHVYTGANGGILFGQYNTNGDAQIQNQSTSGIIAFATNNSERGRFDASGNFYFNSGYGSSAVAYGCRAWAAYNAITPVIKSSGGVSSITKTSTGNYVVNLSTTMPDTNYSAVISHVFCTGNTMSSVNLDDTVSFTTTSFGIKCRNQSNQVTDSVDVTIAVFR
jgi:hypothetical protein